MSYNYDYMMYESLQRHQLIDDESPKDVAIGQLLVQANCITQTQLEFALAFQRKSGGRLGEILTSLEFVEPRQLYRVLARQLGMDRIESISYVTSPFRLPEPVARKYNAVVIGQSDDTVWIAVSDKLSTSAYTELSHVTGKRMEQVLATPYEMEKLWSHTYQRELLEGSIDKLQLEQPNNSALRVLTVWQIITLILIVVLISLGLMRNALQALTVINVVCQLVYFFLAVFKGVILIRGTKGAELQNGSAEQTLDLNEADLPVYTILVPLYHEGNVLSELIDHIEAMDYPKQKLDVRLLLEEDDEETIEAAKRLNPPYYFTFVMVPASEPRTKPKACNYGLIRARGEYAVIFDAEDRPEPNQLKRALAAFQQFGEQTVCLQAKLNYFNSNQNLLTRWFTQEYSHWFGMLLPGVMSMNIPIPLGGTSNHFRMSALKKAGAWDPYNVTEDADLGVRLYKMGFRTGIIGSTTWEEANSRPYNWLRQRTRWIKGYLQTWLVHMRNPWRLYRDLGWRGFWGFQAMVLGTPLLPLMNPPFWAMMFLWYMEHAGWIPKLFPGPIYYMAMLLLIVGNFFFVYSGIIGTYRFCELEMVESPGLLSFRLVRSALLMPVYWALMSVAAYRAVWQLVTRPFYWEKTHHGLATGHTPVNSGKGVQA